MQFVICQSLKDFGDRMEVYEHYFLRPNDTEECWELLEAPGYS